MSLYYNIIEYYCDFQNAGEICQRAGVSSPVQKLKTIYWKLEALLQLKH